jgi:arylsulfatase A-like enzyme
MHELRRVQAEGKLTPVQALYFNPNRPAEELFDTQNDPWEVNNLAADPAHAAKLAELRAECDAWLARCGPLADLHADELVKRGIIQPRDEKYAERLKTGTTAGDAAKKKGKKAANK